MSAKKLCVGIPVVSAVKGEVYHSHLAQMIPLARMFSLFVPCCVDLFPHAAAREHIMKVAMGHECDYLFFLDSDMVPPPDACMKLLDLLEAAQAENPNVVMTTAHAYRRGYPYTGVWTIIGNGERIAGAIAPPDLKRPVDIVSCGLACNLVDLKWVREHLKEPYFFQGQREIEGKLVDIWEDAWFCGTIKAAGGTILGAPWIRCGHLGPTPVINDDNVDWLRKEFIKNEFADNPLHQYIIK